MGDEIVDPVAVDEFVEVNSVVLIDESGKVMEGDAEVSGEVSQRIADLEERLPFEKKDFDPAIPIVGLCFVQVSVSNSDIAI